MTFEKIKGTIEPLHTIMEYSIALKVYDMLFCEWKSRVASSIALHHDDTKEMLELGARIQSFEIKNHIIK